MIRPRHAPLLAAVLLASGCFNPGFELALELQVAPEQQARLDQSDRLVVRVHYPQGGRCIEQSFGTDDDVDIWTAIPTLDRIDPGEDVVIEVELRAGGAVTARGRSQPLDLAPDPDERGAEVFEAGVFVGHINQLARIEDALAAPRAFARAVAIDGGRIAVVGGGNGLRAGGATLDSVEVIGADPTQPVRGLLLGLDTPLPRIGHQVAWIPPGFGGGWEERVLVVGGTFGTGVSTLVNGWGNGFDTVVALDPATGAWEEVASLSSPLMAHEMVWTPEEQLAQLGGFAPPYQPRIQLIDPRDAPEDAVQFATSTTGGTVDIRSREQHAVTRVVLEGRPEIVISGGWAPDDGGPSASVQRWNGLGVEAEGEIVDLPDLAQERFRHTATWLPAENQVLFAGGAERFSPADDETDAGRSLASAEIFDFDIGDFLGRGAFAMMEQRQRHVAVVVSGGTALLCGGIGEAGGTLDSCENYFPSAEGFDFAREDPADPRSAVYRGPSGEGIEVVELPDGRIFFIGGTGPDGPVDDLFVYTPSAWADGLELSRCGE